MQFCTNSNKSVNAHSHPGQGLKGGDITAAAPFKQQNGHKSFCRALPGAAGKARIRHPPGARPRAALPRWQAHLPRGPAESTGLAEREIQGDFYLAFPELFSNMNTKFSWPR